MNDFVLECKNLAKSYHDGAMAVDVLHDINLQVKPSEMISVVGISGSGKSTLLHLLGGLDLPTSGSVIIAGQDISKLSEKQKCRLRNFNLGFIYQFHHLLPEFTALENVSMPLLIRSMPRKEILQQSEYILEQVGLKHRLTHKIGELSGGERQRVAIARALVLNPSCILADEPTGNLDPKNSERVFQLFIDLQKEYKTSVILVTHDMKIAKEAHRVFTISNGVLVSA